MANGIGRQAACWAAWAPSWGGARAMRRRRMSGIVAAIVAGALVLAVGPVGAVAGGREPGGGGSGGFQGERESLKDKDNRKGRVAPSQRQRDLAGSLDARVRWNNFGTPAVLASTGAPLAQGLPSDPVTVAPMGEGAAVLLRQRFGDLPAGVDGLVTIGLRDGKVFHVSSSLARDVSAPPPATLSAQDAARRAARDAGLDLSAVRRVDRVAVPTPLDGPRAAYQVVLLGAAGAGEPVAYSSFVDARDGNVLVREDLV